LTEGLKCPECGYDKHDQCQGTLCDCTHEDELAVSHSRVEAYLRCRRQEWYSYGRKLARVEASTALGLGTAGHRVLAALYSTVLKAGMSYAKQKAAYPGAVKAALSEVDAIYAEGFEDSAKRAPLRLIIEKYLQREPFIDNDWNPDAEGQYLIMAVEKEFRLEWDPESHSSYPFVVDLIVKDPDGYMVVVDNKNVYDLYSHEDTDFLQQIPKYIGGLRALGYKIGNYGIYNMLRTRPDTKAGRPLAEWTRMLTFDIKGARVRQAFEEQVTASVELHELDSLSPEEREQKALRVNNKEICTRLCDFKDLCVEELRGGNTAVLLRVMYEPKKKRDKIPITLEVEHDG
jgi:hypothetical protein